jgi:hypothetical protein
MQLKPSVAFRHRKRARTCPCVGSIRRGSGFDACGGPPNRLRHNFPVKSVVYVIPKRIA